MNVSKLRLFEFTIYVVAVGMITGVLLHYVDNGFPTPRHWAAWPVVLVSFGFLILFAVALFFAIVYPAAAVGKE